MSIHSRSGCNFNFGGWPGHHFHHLFHDFHAKEPWNPASRQPPGTSKNSAMRQFTAAIRWPWDVVFSGLSVATSVTENDRNINSHYHPGCYYPTRGLIWEPPGLLTLELYPLPLISSMPCAFCGSPCGSWRLNAPEKKSRRTGTAGKISGDSHGNGQLTIMWIRQCHKPPRLGMVYATCSWWFGGWFMIVLPTWT